MNRIRLDLYDPDARMEVSVSEGVSPETLAALRKVGEAALVTAKRDAEARATRHMSIREREAWWLEQQDIPALRRVIYEALPSAIAATDLKGRKPYLALERLIALASANSQKEPGMMPERSPWFPSLRVVWVRSPHATRHALALWRRTGRVWTTILVIPLWRKAPNSQSVPRP